MPETSSNSMWMPFASDHFWCRDANGQDYSFQAYLERIRSFHGYPAPGLIIAGKMVQVALTNIKAGVLFDALCETGNCLPDAVQILTPCTIGNGWLKILHFKKFALTLYDKNTGAGCRVWLDADKMESFEHIKCWFYKTRPKPEQDTSRLFEQIFQAGADILSLKQVVVDIARFEKKKMGERAICPICKEVFPADHGNLCRSCQGNCPFFPLNPEESSSPPPFLKSVPVDKAEGEQVLHDMTQIIPGQFKGPAYRAGQKIAAGDICRLQTMGRKRVYVSDASREGVAPDDSGDRDWIHENQAALRFAPRMAGQGVTYDEVPREGRIDFSAARNGLLMVDTARLEAFNQVPEVMCATRKGYSMVSEAVKIGGTRAIPLYLANRHFRKAMRVLEAGPLLRVLPLRKVAAGILVTGSEIADGLMQDRFAPIIAAKLKQYGCWVAGSVIAPDEQQKIANSIEELLAAGAQLIITTAGLSVDPDDVTRKGLVTAGAENIRYGAPILPGAMTLLARIGPVPVIGVPACALFYKITAFDLLLPRLLAGLDITRQDLARLGHGAFCWQCRVCRYPKCAFGQA